MIYTVTFNPSLDYIIQVDSLHLGEVNRTTGEKIYPGGKGVNVSIVLKNLGFDNVALGFIAGFTGNEVERQVQSFGCNTDFIRLDQGNTRINVKIQSAEESEINGQGPQISPENFMELLNRLDKLEKDDILVLAGSIPNTLSNDTYEKIFERIEDKGVRVVVDTTRELMLNVLKYRPFLIKPNTHELGEMFGVKLHTDAEIIAYAGKLQKMGARNVLVSMAGKGAIFLADDGRVSQSLPPKGRRVNSVGAGDSMVAGFLAGYLETGDYSMAVKMGLCTGSASAFSEWLATREQVEQLMKTL